MTGLDKDIFRATRRLTTLLNEACNHWNYLCPYLEELDSAANRALKGYQKDYPDDVETIITEDRESAIRPPRNCDVGTAEEQYDRWGRFCQYRNAPLSQNRSCYGCPVYDAMGNCKSTCELIWAQMPYEGEGEKR